MFQRIHPVLIKRVYFSFVVILPVWMTLTYVGSYFLVASWKKHTGDKIEASFAGSAGDAYRPVYWMIDETPLRPFLLEVSRSLGVEQEVEHASHTRTSSVLFLD